MIVDKARWSDIIDGIGLGSIGLYVYLCTIFGSGFAVLHFNLANHVPFFVSEQCLLLGFILLAIKLVITKGFRPWHCVWILYGLWILWATWCGLQNGTFLALRNAALFYYAFFALLSFSFYNGRLLRSPVIYWVMLGLLALSMATRVTAFYYYFTCTILAIVLSLRIPLKPFRYITIGLLMFWYSQFVFIGSRSHEIANLFAIIFIVVYFIIRLTKWHLYFRLGALFFFFLVLGVGVKHFSDPNSIKSLTNISELNYYYTSYEVIVNSNADQYVPRKLDVRLYDDDINDRRVRDQNAYLDSFQKAARTTLYPQTKKIPDTTVGALPSPYNYSEAVPSGVSSLQLSKVTPDVLHPTNPAKAFFEYHPPREIGNECGDILFRWYIWRDMWRELLETHSLWGVGLGKPQRSKSLEILQLASTEWQRDGWIAPHNSFFHMIYRAGIIGVLIIVLIVAVFLLLFKIFITHDSLAGVMLLSILVYWMVMANFLVILELPYNAVLFWAIFGVCGAYAGGLKNASRV